MSPVPRESTFQSKAVPNPRIYYLANCFESPIPRQVTPAANGAFPSPSPTILWDEIRCQKRCAQAKRRFARRCFDCVTHALPRQRDLVHPNHQYDELAMLKLVQCRR
jgi:hypothetical protein